MSSSGSSPTSKVVSKTGNKTFRYEMWKNLSGFTPIMKCLIASFYNSSRGKTGIQNHLSTPKFGTLYHFTKVTSDDVTIMT